jgi:hypothetical protein
MTKTTLPANEIIRYWNSCSNLVAHTRPESKVYQTAVKYIDLINSGQFCGRYILDPDYIEEQGLTQEDLSKAWSDEEIKQSIERFSYMCGPDHVADKQYYPRNLPEFIYNPRSQRSFMYSLLGEFRDVPGRPVKCLDNATFEFYRLSFFEYAPLDKDGIIALTKAVNHIILQQRHFQEIMGQFCYRHPLKGQDFFRHHRWYLEDEYYGRPDFSPKFIGPFTYGGFGPWLFKNFAINLTPDRNEIEQAKKVYAAEEIKMQENDRRYSEQARIRKEWLENRGCNPWQVQLNTEN